MDHSIVVPSLDELIEGAVRSHVGDDAEDNLASFVGIENRSGLSCLGFRADSGFDCIALSSEFLDGWDANKTIS